MAMRQTQLRRSARAPDRQGPATRVDELRSSPCAARVPAIGPLLVCPKAGALQRTEHGSLPRTAGRSRGLSHPKDRIAAASDRSTRDPQRRCTAFIDHRGIANSSQPVGTSGGLLIDRSSRDVSLKHSHLPLRDHRDWAHGPLKSDARFAARVPAHNHEFPFFAECIARISAKARAKACRMISSMRLMRGSS